MQLGVQLGERGQLLIKTTANLTLTPSSYPTPRLNSAMFIVQHYWAGDDMIFLPGTLVTECLIP